MQKLLHLKNELVSFSTKICFCGIYCQDVWIVKLCYFSLDIFENLDGLKFSLQKNATSLLSNIRLKLKQSLV